MYFLPPDILKFAAPVVFTKGNSESATLSARRIHVTPLRI